MTCAATPNWRVKRSAWAKLLADSRKLRTMRKRFAVGGFKDRTLRRRIFELEGNIINERSFLRRYRPDGGRRPRR